MNFKIDRKSFLEKLNIISRAISQFSPSPILSGIYMQVDPDKITLIGSGNELQIQSVITPGEVNQLRIEEPGTVIVESKYFVELIRKLECTTLSIESVDASSVKVKSDNGDYSLNGITQDQYPSIDFSMPETSFNLSGKDLKDLINTTIFACSDKNNRPVLTGVNFSAGFGTLSVSSTDSYRLARKQLGMLNDLQFNITVPSNSLNELNKSLTDQDDVEICLNKNKIMFIFDKNIIQSSIIDGTFPDVERIIPLNPNASLVVDTHEISHAIDRTNFIRQEKVHIIKMNLNESEVRLKTSSNDIGKTNEKLSSAQYEGGDMVFTFNGTYLLDAIRALKGEKIKFEFVGSMAPVKISSLEDESAVMVVVPVRSFD
jgi:DNA polymerase-3 subunit beta